MTSSVVELEGKNTPIYGFDIDSLLQYEIIHSDFKLKGSGKQQQYIDNEPCNTRWIQSSYHVL